MSTTLEVWLSGLKRSPAKTEMGYKPIRGFESLHFRFKQALIAQKVRAGNS